jgi:hypothetical protein
VASLEAMRTEAAPSEIWLEAAAVMVPFSRNAGAQGGQAFEGGVASWAFVVDEGFVVDGDGGDFAGEVAFFDGGESAAVAFEAEGVDGLAAEAPALGDEFGGEALGDDVEAVEDLFGEGAAVAAHGHAAHALDASADDEVVGAAHDGLCGEVDGLEGAGAHAVDGGAADGDGEASGEGGLAANIKALFADLGDAAMITSSTSWGSIPVRRMSARRFLAAKSSGRMRERKPPRRPMGVLTASRMKASAIERSSPVCGPRRDR